MARRKKDPDHGYAVEPDPGDEIVHVQPKPGETIIYDARAYGDRATLQVPRRDLERVVGSFEEIDPAKVPDVAQR